MILAEKIVRLRKRVGWSQEELATKMSVSRQSVSKWEATNSIPDLSKILRLAEIFEVSTDYLLKDNVEISEPTHGKAEANAIQISLEQAMAYVESKVGMSRLVAKGVFLSVCSVIPLFAILAMADADLLGLTKNVAVAIGLVFILVMVTIGIGFFIRTNQYEGELALIDNEEFDLAYGVRGAIKEKLQKYRGTYNLRVSVSISLFIFSFVPLMFGSMFYDGSEIVLMMINVLLLMVATGIYIMVPASARYEAYNNILKKGGYEPIKSRRAKRAEKLAAFYWPLLTAIYIGWSLWTMEWGTTWIVWPVGAILFAALVGLMELLDKDDY